MGRRQIKNTYVTSVRLRVKLGHLTPEQGATFEGMFAKCRQPDEFAQVRAALENVCFGIRTAKDRYALAWQEDPLGLDEYEAKHFGSE